MPPSSGHLDYSGDSPGKYFLFDLTYRINLPAPQVPHNPLGQCHVIISIVPIEYLQPKPNSSTPRAPKKILCPQEIAR